MLINCFCASGAGGIPVEPTEPIARPANTKKFIRRQSSAKSRSSTGSNSSISKLPPCKRVSDPKIEAMMMPLPLETRPSYCLRLSQPKTYSNIVDSMKASKGCRDWRNFAVFHPDDVDMSISAEDIARRRAADYERKLRQLSTSFDSASPVSERDSIEVDMIG